MGFCKAKKEMEVAYIGLHSGEEPFVSGTKGSGAIFFAHCNMRCIYCQNWQISQPIKYNPDWKISPEKLAEKMIELQNKGTHNINLVSPAHYAPQIIESLLIAKNKGLTIPIVYNSNGYESLETLKLLNGIIDIYLPDIKYSDNKIAEKYSKVGDYVENNRRAIVEMYKQVGILKLDDKGIAINGIIVRHLVLPNEIAGSFESLDFLASISNKITISLMAQYNPCHKAITTPLLDRKITQTEYQKVVNYALKLGFKNILIQELESSENYNPDFSKEKPFLEPSS
jgi:putative pyruvate formate lyase activating enzyme